jgi:hypothetical protein
LLALVSAVLKLGVQRWSERAHSWRAPTVRRVSIFVVQGRRGKELGVMEAMRKRTVVALTAAVWLAAAGSAAALTVELNRPLAVVESTSQPKPAFSTTQAAEVPIAKAASVLNVPTVTIVGRAVHRPGANRTTKPPTDISRMRCKDWQPLQAGSGRVQICE